MTGSIQQILNTAVRYGGGLIQPSLGARPAGIDADSMEPVRHLTRMFTYFCLIMDSEKSSVNLAKQGPQVRRFADPEATSEEAVRLIVGVLEALAPVIKGKEAPDPKYVEITPIIKTREYPEGTKFVLDSRNLCLVDHVVKVAKSCGWSLERLTNAVASTLVQASGQLITDLLAAGRNGKATIEGRSGSPTLESQWDESRDQQVVRVLFPGGSCLARWHTGFVNAARNVCPRLAEDLGVDRQVPARQGDESFLLEWQDIKARKGADGQVQKDKDGNTIWDAPVRQDLVTTDEFVRIFVESLRNYAGFLGKDAGDLLKVVKSMLDGTTAEQPLPPRLQ